MSIEFLINLSKVVLIIATVVAIARWSQLEEKGLKWFPYYMLFSVAIEVVVYIGQDSVRAFSYTLYDIVTYLFISIYFYILLGKDKKILVLCLGYILALFVSLATEDVSETLKIQSTAGTIVTFLCTIIYFTTLLKSEAVLDFTRLPSFWIAIGLVVFNLGYLPITFSLNAAILPHKTTVYTIVTIVAIILYSCYTIAFLCKKET